MNKTLGHPKRHSFYTCFFFAIFSFSTLFVKAGNISSTNAGGNWSATTTWVGGVVPGVSDVATIVSGSTVTVDISTASCAALNINTGVAGGGATATLIFNSGSALTVSGIVTVGASGAGRRGSINMTAGGTLIAQQFTITRAGTWTPGTGAINLSATNTLPATFFTTFNDLIISAGTTTTGRALTINGNLSILDGAVFAIAGFNLTVTGTTTIGNGASGILSFASAAGAKVFVGLVTINANGSFTNSSNNSAVTLRGGITNNGVSAAFDAGTGVYTFNTNNQSLTGTFVIPNVTVTTIVLTNNNTLTVTTSLAGSGTLTQASNALLNIGAASGITTLQATNSGNTVNYTGTAQTIKSANYYNLILSGSGADVMPAAAITIGGDFTLSGTVSTTTRGAYTINGNIIIGDGTTFTAAGFALTINGTTTVGSGTSGNMIISAAAGVKTFADLVRINNGATWNNSGNSAITIENGITNSGTFTSGTGVYTFNTNSQDLNGVIAITNVTVTGVTLTNNNTLTVGNALTGTGTFTQAAGATLNIGNTITITTLSATNNGNTVNYSRAGNQTVLSTSYYHLILSTSGTKTAGGNLTVLGNFTISAGPTFNAGALVHSLSGNFANNGTFNAQTSTMTFNGSTAQIIGGSSITTFASLTIDNVSGVSLDDGINSTNKSVSTTLNLNSGYLTTNSNNVLILNNNATATVANASTEAGTALLIPQHNSPYINGPMRKIGNQAFIFPVGVTGTGCVPIGISAPAAVTDAFDAQYTRSSAGSLGPITSPNLFNVSICEYWTLNRTTGASTVDVTGYWDENSPCNGESAGQYVTDLTTISLAHFNGTSWDNNSTSVNSSTVGTTIAGGIKWSAVSTFSPFALGNNSAAKINPLPILLDYFTAIKFNGYNQLSWKAECNSSSARFIVERSSNGTNFDDINTVVINNAADCSQPFNYKDYTNTGNKTYYRLRMIDVDGNVNYSDIKLILSGASSIELLGVKPNPVQTSAWLNISASQAGGMEIVLLSIDGRELQHKKVQLSTGLNTINLQTGNLAKGIYVIKGIFNDGQTNTVPFTKQ